MNFLYLPSSEQWINMTYCQSFEPFGLSAVDNRRLLVYSDGRSVVMSDQDDIDKIIQYLNRIAYC